MTCTCCGRPLEDEPGEKCHGCASGCRCQLTQEQEAAADRLVDEMADAAGLGDVEPEEEHGRDCTCYGCCLLFSEAAEDRADTQAKEERRNEAAP